MSPPTLWHTLLPVWEAGSRRGSSGETRSLIEFGDWLLLEAWQPPTLHWSACCCCQQLRRGDFWNMCCSSRKCSNKEDSASLKAHFQLQVEGEHAAVSPFWGWVSVFLGRRTWLWGYLLNLVTFKNTLKEDWSLL